MSSSAREGQPCTRVTCARGGVAMTETAPRTIHEVIDRYNTAFRVHEPTLLVGLISDECVIEDTGPAPDGARHESGRACLARWSDLAGDADLNFSTEPAEILGDL